MNEKITIEQAIKLLEELHEFGNIEDEKTFDALKMAIAAMRGNVPDWSHAPEWAKWLSRNSLGVFYWHDEKPGFIYPGIWAGGVLVEKVAPELWQRPTE